MLLIRSLLLSFVASIHCSSIYAGARIYNIGCANPIHQELDTVQALKPNLKKHLQFGELPYTNLCKGSGYLLVYQGTSIA